MMILSIVIIPLVLLITTTTTTTTIAFEPFRKFLSPHNHDRILMRGGGREQQQDPHYEEDDPYNDDNNNNDDNDYPEGFIIKHNVISEDAWKILEHWLQNDSFLLPVDDGDDDDKTTKTTKTKTKTESAAPIPWENGPGSQHRRVAQFGFRYNYETSVVEEFRPGVVPEIPQPLRTILLDAFEKQQHGIINNNPSLLPSTIPKFTQCIINVYQPDDIIPWHWDHVDFGPIVLVFTFGEDRPLHLRRLLKNNNNNKPQLPSTQCHHEEGIYDEQKDYEYRTVYPRHRSCYILSGPVRYEWEHSIPPGGNNGYRVSITFRTHIKESNN